METRWAPTIVINGVLNRIKWPYKWISGVISLLYRSYSGHLLLVGTHYCRWWHWRFLGVTKKFSRGLRILSEILRSPTASHIQLPSWLVRTSLRVSKWRSSSRSDQSDQHALALQVWRDHRVRGVVEKKNRRVTDLEPFFASMILDENAKFGKQICLGYLAQAELQNVTLHKNARKEIGWDIIYIYSLLPNGLALDGAYSPMASPGTIALDGAYSPMASYATIGIPSAPTTCWRPMGCPKGAIISPGGQVAKSIASNIRSSNDNQWF